MKRYKLLNQDRTTRGGMEWPIGKWNKATGDKNQGLCSDGWLHCYDDPCLALFMNPIHADITNPIVCEVETKGRSLNNHGLKRGYREMRVVKDLNIRALTSEERTEVAIRCALEVCQEESFVKWANGWLSGKDRSARSAMSAAESVWSAAESAAEISAARSAMSAAESVWSAAESAELAVWSAARSAAESAAESGKKFSLKKIIHEVIKG